MHTRVVLTILATVLLQSRPEVSAQDVDVVHFLPSTGFDDLLGVSTTKTPGHLGLSAGLITHLANDELRLPGAEGLARPVADRWRAELTLAAGITDLLEIGLGLPVNIWQVDHPSPGDGPSRSSTGLGGMRASVKARLLGSNSSTGLGLATAMELIFPTNTGSDLMNDRFLGFAPKIIADYRHHSGFVAAVNLGYRYRVADRLGEHTLKHQIHLDLGAEIPLGLYGLSAVGELLSTIGLDNEVADEATSPTELLGALRYRHDDLVLTVGVGAGLTDSYGAPDWRVLAALGYRLPPVDSQPHANPAILHSQPANPERERREETASADGELDAAPAPAKPPASMARPTTAPSVKEPRIAASELVHTEQNAGPPLPSEESEGAQPEAVEIEDGAFDRAVERDPDPDGDGLTAAADDCPQVREDMDGFEDADGCPDLDNDRDGIPDAVDACPVQAETINGTDDDDGCPDKGESKIALKAGKITISEQVFFEPSSDKIDSRSRPILRQLARFLKAAWNIRLVRIEGHSDERGDPEMNVYLSERRARQVREYLIQRGIAPRRLEAKGYGPTQPISPNDTWAGRAKNRRVEFRVLRVHKPEAAQ